MRVAGGHVPALPLAAAPVCARVRVSPRQAGRLCTWWVFGRVGVFSLRPPFHPLEGPHLDLSPNTKLTEHHQLPLSARCAAHRGLTQPGPSRQSWDGKAAPSHGQSQSRTAQGMGGQGEAEDGQPGP